jgi:hypothetical protein
MPYKTVEVWIDDEEIKEGIDEFDDHDLIDELEHRGYYVGKAIPDGTTDSIATAIWALYQAYITETDASFRRTAAKVFWEHLGKTA